MARVTCHECGHDWKRRVTKSRGQPIRCPKCNKTIGRLSKPMKPHQPKEYIEGKAVNEYGRRM